MSAPYRYPSQFNQPIPGATAPVNMATQRFCLRWNNHQSNLLSVFDQLLQNESFVDVTLAVEGKLLKAHKMVLSACSPYFQTLFVNHPDKHPIVILKDVPYSDMKSLLDFMYRGEVSVDQDRLTHFLRVAECLRIKGLTEVNEEKCDNIANSLSNQNTQIPNLQRVQQSKRVASSQQSFNMLGNYLMSQPKRKRGRPRRLSGNETDETDGKDSVIQGSPEMLEFKMGMDGFTGNNSDESIGRDDDDGRIRDEDDDAIPGTSQSEKYGDSRTSEEIQAGEILYLDSSQENNQNHSNLIPTSVAMEVEIFPIKHESVIISTETARNMMNNDNNNEEYLKVKIEPDDNFEDDVHIKIEPEEFESADTVEADIKTEEFESTIHFLTAQEFTKETYEKKKNEFLEYLPNQDGSVVCKRCGEVLPSRTHWYRHKYKFHVASTSLVPAPLFKCERCSVFFKSRKGYMGHVASRHSEKHVQQQEPVIHFYKQVKVEEPVNSAVSVVKKKLDKVTDWKEQRSQEEKLVADIIDRVKKECEAQGGRVTRKGYTRRTTVMNVNVNC